ncbi:MAG: hypothetical protein KGL39_15195 [Patescibacteria group bacterium]|nr:hypothetical protein [Patescibacteria group bacterium]
MALIVITLVDTDDGSVDISAKAEPYLPGPASEEETTPAQASALVMLGALAQALTDSGVVDEDPEG